MRPVKNYTIPQKGEKNELAATPSRRAPRNPRRRLVERRYVDDPPDLVLQISTKSDR